MRMLEKATERGLELLDEIRKMAAERTGEDDIGVAYSRISKAIRQSVMLHAKLEEDAAKTDAQRQAEEAVRAGSEARRAAALVAGQQEYHKSMVQKAVQLAITVDMNEDETLDCCALETDLLERLDDYDAYSDFDRKSVGEVVESICRVMDLTFEPALWEYEPWAIAEMAEKPEGSPFADWSPETANDDDGPHGDPEDDEDDPYGLAEDDDPPRRGSGAGPPWAAE